MYVASSSRDLITSLGGRTPGSFARLLGPVGRFFGIGLGVDPAMDSFGAVRVTAEFPGTMNLPYTGGTHHAYFQHTDSTSDPSTRTESLANLGRISAGQIERLELEQHRTADGRRTIEPAAERAGPRRFWNPSWGRVPNCAQLVATELSAIYGRDIPLAVSPSRRGVPARALFEAIGANADFTTYADVANTLQHMPEGSTAVLVSRWSGGRQGGHAYLAGNTTATSSSSTPTARTALGMAAVLGPGCGRPHRRRLPRFQRRARRPHQRRHSSAARRRRRGRLRPRSSQRSRLRPQTAGIPRPGPGHQAGGHPLRR